LLPPYQWWFLLMRSRCRSPCPRTLVWELPITDVHRLLSHIETSTWRFRGFMKLIWSCKTGKSAD
jgi:hypothetical protein